MSGWNQEQEYQAGIRAERERIIEVLEEMFDEWIDIRLETLIALIKGENQ